MHRLETDYIDLGMIHYVDQEAELEQIVKGPFYRYVKELRETGVIRHIGMSTHNPAVAKRAVELGIVEMMLFSVNPAFDLLPAAAVRADAHSMSRWRRGWRSQRRCSENNRICFCRLHALNGLILSRK